MTGRDQPIAPRVLDVGDAALCVDFGNRIDPLVNARVIALDAAVRALALPGIVEAVPTYRSLMIHVDPCVLDRGALVDTLHAALAADATEVAQRRRWQVPVVYGRAFGVDLELIAQHAGLTPKAFVDAHAAGLYRVYMIGFMPGFSYLGGMDQKLAMPRRTTPRPRVPPSSVAIGGGQTAIGSLESPSGWHLIGRTPARPYMAGRDPEFLFAPGDEIVFRPVAESEWEGLETAAKAGDPVARRID